MPATRRYGNVPINTKRGLILFAGLEAVANKAHVDTSDPNVPPSDGDADGSAGDTAGATTSDGNATRLVLCPDKCDCDCHARGRIHNKLGSVAQADDVDLLPSGTDTRFRSKRGVQPTVPCIRTLRGVVAVGDTLQEVCLRIPHDPANVSEVVLRVAYRRVDAARVRAAGITIGNLHACPSHTRLEMTLAPLALAPLSLPASDKQLTSMPSFRVRGGAAASPKHALHRSLSSDIVAEPATQEEKPSPTLDEAKSDSPSGLDEGRPTWLLGDDPSAARLAVSEARVVVDEVQATVPPTFAPGAPVLMQTIACTIVHGPMLGSVRAGRWCSRRTLRLQPADAMWNSATLAVHEAGHTATDGLLGVGGGASRTQSTIVRGAAPPQSRVQARRVLRGVVSTGREFYEFWLRPPRELGDREVHRRAAFRLVDAATVRQNRIQVGQLHSVEDVGTFDWLLGEGRGNTGDGSTGGVGQVIVDTLVGTYNSVTGVVKLQTVKCCVQVGTRFGSLMVGHLCTQRRVKLYLTDTHWTGARVAVHETHSGDDELDDDSDGDVDEHWARPEGSQSPLRLSAVAVHDEGSHSVNPHARARVVSKPASNRPDPDAATRATVKALVRRIVESKPSGANPGRSADAPRGLVSNRREPAVRPVAGAGAVQQDVDGDDDDEDDDAEEAGNRPRTLSEVEKEQARHAKLKRDDSMIALV